MPEADSCELRTPVRVEDEAWWWAAPGQSTSQGLTRKLGIKTIAERPADDLAREQVDDRDEKQKAADHGQVRRVGGPNGGNGLDGDRWQHPLATRCSRVVARHSDVAACLVEEDEPVRVDRLRDVDEPTCTCG
jgi:hypothetical protein